MTQDPDWSALGETWRASPPLDVEALHRKVQNKRRVMALMVSLEIALTLVGSAVLVRVAWRASHGHQRAWALTVLALAWVLQGLVLVLRRAQWRTPTLRAEDLLELIARRARTAIVLVWVNVAGVAALALTSIPFAIQWWRDRPPGGSLWPKIAVNAALLPVLTIFSVWYVRRQRRTLRRVKALRDELKDARSL
jgi:hypothetical protein